MGLIYKLYKAIIQLRARNYIAPVPRMLREDFDHQAITPDVARAMARYRVRSPRGLELVMEREGVSSIDELMRLSPHYQPKRRARRRLQFMLARITGGQMDKPRAGELQRAFRRRARTDDQIALEDRLKSLIGDREET